ncbi:conserved hypothetical protein, partial [Ricinus communis]
MDDDRRHGRDQRQVHRRRGPTALQQAVNAERQNTHDRQPAQQHQDHLLLMPLAAARQPAPAIGAGFVATPHRRAQCAACGAGSDGGRSAGWVSALCSPASHIYIAGTTNSVNKVPIDSPVKITRPMA